MKIVFFGSDDFAEAHLKALIASGHNVLACVTQPDKARGRGLKVVVSPVKACAQHHGLPVFQPVSLKDEDFIARLKALAADMFIVIAYGRFLPEDVLRLPRFGAWNVHGSLLPKYRGAAPINWAIINGETETGLSIIKINPFMDAGEVVSSLRMKIEKEDTAVTLRARMMQVGPPFLLKTIQSLERDELVSILQDAQAATFAPKLTKALGHIQWTKPAREIHHLVRGLLPWPAAYTFCRGKLLKILSTDVMEEDAAGPAGRLVDIRKEGLVIATGLHQLLVKQVHPESSRPMEASSFAAGHQLKPGFVFDEGFEDA